MKNLLMVICLGFLFFGCASTQSFYYTQTRILDEAEVYECWTDVMKHSTDGTRKFVQKCYTVKMDAYQLTYWQKLNQMRKVYKTGDLKGWDTSVKFQHVRE